MSSRPVKRHRGIVERLGLLFGGGLGRIEAQVAAQPQQPLALPASVPVGAGEVRLRLLEPNDREMLLAFARSLPEEDLLFLRRDITRDEEVAAWLRDVEEGLSRTVLALSGDEIVGYATVASDRLSWTRHVAELRVLVSPEWCGQGLGRVLTAQAFAIAKERGVRKMLAQMTTDQEAARRAFERMGFESEAVLRRQVIDREGRLHDLRIMSIDVEEFQRRLEAARAQAEVEARGI